MAFTVGVAVYFLWIGGVVSLLVCCGCADAKHEAKTTPLKPPPAVSQI